VSAVLPADSKKAPSITPEQKAEITEAKAEADKQKVAVQKLDKEYSVLLAEWKKQYPGDAVIFDSSSRVDIPSVQKALKDDQIALQYILLPDKLMIIVISKDKDKVECVSNNDIGKEKLDIIIKNEFLVGHINNEKHNGIKTLHTLYEHLIQPVEKYLENKNRIYVITDGFLSQVPFNALVLNNTSELYDVEFLITKYEIANIRPSFITSIMSAKDKKPTKTFLAVANPRNETIISMKYLQGAIDEITTIKGIMQDYIDRSNMNIEYTANASDIWLIDKLKNTNYEIIYFATHGLPYSEVYTQYYINKEDFINKVPKMIKNKKNEEVFPEYKNKSLDEVQQLAKQELIYIQNKLNGHSPLNGYLYMAVDKNMPESTGVLTIKQLVELARPDGKDPFENTRYVVLSACNTAVTFAPKALVDSQTATVISQHEAELEARNIEKSLRKSGWIPGQDQVSFVDLFMRRSVSNVYGTLWQADDLASSFLLSHFISTLLDQQKQHKVQDAVAAYTSAQRDYINSCIKGIGELSRSDLSPRTWAFGAIFGM
jgi:CHAT domain-containing protein